MKESRESQRLVVINADDLGICQGVNEAISEAHRFGVLTSASIMTNGVAFEHAIETVVDPLPKLGVGLHLCLTSGKCLSAPHEIPDLVDASGQFRCGFLSLMRVLRSRPKSILQQIQMEVDAQFLRAKRAGAVIDHVDGHRYIHMIPAIFEITVRIAKSYGCCWIRFPQESIGPAKVWCRMSRAVVRGRNLPKKLLLSRLAAKNRSAADACQFADNYHGILDSGAVFDSTLHFLLRYSTTGVTEIATHPAKKSTIPVGACGAGDQAFLSSDARQKELAALLAENVVEVCGQDNLRLTNYMELATSQPVRHH